MKALKLPFTFDRERLRADLAEVRDDEWSAHFNRSYYEGEWGGVSLRSTSGETRQLYPDPAKDTFLDTPLLERTPCFREILNTFECEILAARLLILRAGSRIREHRDHNLSIEDGEFRVHVPVQTNPDLVFMLGGERVVMEEGSSWYLNVNHPHSVANGGGADRIHLVFDCVVNDWVRGMISRCTTLEFLERVRQHPTLEQRLRDCEDTDSFVNTASELGPALGFEPHPEVLRALIRERRREALQHLL